MSREKIITYEEVSKNETLDANGKYSKKEQITHSKKKVEVEEDFIKLYLKDLCRLNDIPKTGNEILNELLLYTDYQNKILLPSGIKKSIIEKYKISMGTLDNNLSKLLKLEIIKKLGTGVYQLNPYLFGKGKWENVKSIRVQWSYGPNGRGISGLEVETNPFNTDYKEEEKIA